MNKIIGSIVIVGIVVVVAIAGAFLAGAFEPPYYVKDTDFGVWHDEVTIEYTDGTEVSFKLIEAQYPFAVTHEGKEISNINMKLSAVVTGTGYDGAELKFDVDTDGYKFGYATQVFYPDLRSLTLRHITKEPGTIVQVPIDTTKIIAESNVRVGPDIEDRESDFPDGQYKVKFDMRGKCFYRGYPAGGDWVSVSLPIDRYVTIDISRGPVTGTIVVTLISGTEAT